MRDRLIELLQDNSYLDVLDDEHWLLAAEQLIANGVTILPEGAIILTRAEIDALNKYEEARKNEAN